VVELLLDRGARPDATSHGGATALHSAAQNGDEALVELLLARGADPARPTDAGAGAADLARKAGHAMIAARLEAEIHARAAQIAEGDAIRG
jgi:uncharacterized protein